MINVYILQYRLDPPVGGHGFKAMPRITVPNTDGIEKIISLPDYRGATAEDAKRKATAAAEAWKRQQHGSGQTHVIVETPAPPEVPCLPAPSSSSKTMQPCAPHWSSN